MTPTEIPNWKDFSIRSLYQITSYEIDELGIFTIIGTKQTSLCIYAEDMELLKYNRQFTLATVSASTPATVGLNPNSRWYNILSRDELVQLIKQAQGSKVK